MSIDHESKCEQLTATSHKLDGQERYFEFVHSGVSHHEVMDKFVVVMREDIHNSDLWWRRFIQSALEQSLVVLRSSQGFIFL